MLIGSAALAWVFIAWPRPYHFEETALTIESPKRMALLPMLRATVLHAKPKPFAGSLNVLIAGIPGKDNPAPNLTDTVMVAHINTETNRAYLFSLPRDLLVRAPDSAWYSRLNNLYERGGITALRLKAEDVTGLEIHRYIVADLNAVREIVDALDGVNVYVEKDIFDPRFPGSGATYDTFELKKGWRYLDGKTATRYVRTRNDRDGDFGRMRRQQQLLEALKEKITGLSYIWDIPIFLKIFDSVEKHMRTNFSAGELVQIFEWARALTHGHTSITPLDADPAKHLFASGDFWFGNERADIVKPIQGIEQYAAVRAYVEQVIKNRDW